MIWLIISMIAIALAGGCYVASLHYRNTPPAKKIALVHGIIGTTAVLLLVGLAIFKQNNALLIPIGAFVVVVLGGSYLFSFRKKSATPPGSAIAIHALVALLASGLLIYIGIFK